MKLRVTIAAILVMALAIPVVAASISYPDVHDKHSTAVDYVSKSGILPPDSRVSGDLYGARRLVHSRDIVNAIRTFEAMEERKNPGKGNLRREEFASFLLAGIQKVRELRAPTTTTTTTTQPTTTTTKSIPSLRAGNYIVGRDISPGVYRVSVNRHCYWERARDASGSLRSIIANGNEFRNFYIEVKRTDYILKLSCR